MSVISINNPFINANPVDWGIYEQKNRNEHSGNWCTSVDNCASRFYLARGDSKTQTRKVRACAFYFFASISFFLIIPALEGGIFGIATTIGTLTLVAFIAYKTFTLIRSLSSKEKPKEQRHLNREGHLINAAEEGSLWKMRFYLFLGANPNHRTLRSRDIPLHKMCRNFGNMESEKALNMMQRLIDRHSFVNLLGDDEMTPLDIAVENLNVEVVRLLIQNGAYINLETEERPSSYVAIQNRLNGNLTVEERERAETIYQIFEESIPNSLLG